MIPEPIDPEPAAADRPRSEREDGRGGFAGKVSHTDHLYPPTN
jgi:hypothetical protein